MIYRNGAPRKERRNRPEDVRMLQSYLRGLSFAHPELPLVAVDGIYGAQTAQAAAAFQESRGLPRTGQTDPETFEAVREAYNQLSAMKAPACMPCVFPRGPGARLETGMSGDAVFVLQLMLRAIARRFCGIPSPELNGVYDAPTQNAVRALHGAGASADAAVRDTVDKDLWDRIAQAYNSFQQDP